MKNSRFTKTIQELVKVFGEIRREIEQDSFILIEWKVQSGTRTLEQNKKLWAMLTDISEQVIYGGTKFTQDDWKDIISASFKGEQLRMAPTLDGSRLVLLGMSTSKMKISEKAEFIEYIYSEFSDRVFWSDPKDIINSVESS